MKQDFQKLTDAKCIQILNKSYNLDKNELYSEGAPILLSSVNKWILTRFLDVRIFTHLLKESNPEVIKKLIKRQQKTFNETIKSSKKQMSVQPAINSPKKIHRTK